MKKNISRTNAAMVNHRLSQLNGLSFTKYNMNSTIAQVENAVHKKDVTIIAIMYNIVVVSLSFTNFEFLCVIIFVFN